MMGSFKKGMNIINDAFIGSFSVTALNYLHQAASLVVGYEFGCFHIFSMETFHITLVF